MNSEQRWQRVRDLFDQLSPLGNTERGQRLETIRLDDPELAEEVHSLLSSGEHADKWFGNLATQLGHARTAEIDASWARDRSIGPYALLGLLGTGGMGSVFRARRQDGQIDREVALKVVPAGLDSPDAIKRFLHERDILASLSHPNIAQLLDAGVSDEGKPWFALEYVQGKPITQWCDQHRLSLSSRIELFLQLARAVQFAHRNLIVHRDLKPGNVLVNTEGAVKLLDFGIAKLLGEEQLETATASRLLTPAYAAPEQLLGQPLSTATDVYALGVILHELLTGLRPRSAASLVHGQADTTDTLAPSRLVAAVNSGRIDSAELSGDQLAAVRGAKPDGLSRSLRGDLDVILLKALSREPERRYASAGQLADDLQRYSSGQPISARPDSLGYRLNKLVRRHPWASTAAILVMVASLAFAFYAREQARILALERDRAEQIVEFLSEVFSVSDPERAQGQEITARELLSRGVSRAQAGLTNEPELAAEFLAILGRTHQNLGDYETAEALLDQVLKLHRNELQSPASAMARALLDLGEARRLSGSYESSRVLLREALELVKPEAPAADPVLYAEALSRLGRVLGVLGDHQRSFELLSQSLELTRRLPNLDQLLLATRLNDLASAHFRAGRFEKAQGILEESVALHRALDRRANIPVGRPETATALNNLALAFYLQGQHGKAEPLFREALSMRQTILEGTHPEIAQSQTNLGLLLRDMNRLDQAEAALREALRIRTGSLQQDHPLISQAQNNLAMLLQSQGELGESEQLFSLAARGLINHFGEMHPQVASVYTNLGQTLLLSSRADEAQASFLQSLEIRRQTLPPQHPYLAWSLVGLARAELAMGKPEDALPAAREALEIRTLSLPPDDPLVGEARMAYGQALMMLGDYPGARTQLDQSYAVLQGASAFSREQEQIKIMLGELSAMENAELVNDLP